MQEPRVVWQCVLCRKTYLDKDFYPTLTRDLTNETDGVERQLYWIGIEPICAACAIPRGIPPVD